MITVTEMIETSGSKFNFAFKNDFIIQKKTRRNIFADKFSIQWF